MLRASDPRVLQPPAHPIPPWQPAGYQDFALAKLDALGAVLSAPAFLKGAGSTRGMRGGGQSVHGPPPPMALAAWDEGWHSWQAALSPCSCGSASPRWGRGDLKCLLLTQLEMGNRYSAL